MIMKFQELLAAKQINWDRVKLIRHNLTRMKWQSTMSVVI